MQSGVLSGKASGRAIKESGSAPQPCPTRCPRCKPHATRPSVKQISGQPVPLDKGSSYVEGDNQCSPQVIAPG